MDSFLVSQLGQILFGKCKNFALIDATKLGIDFQVFFVQRLQTGIEQSRQQRILDLFDDLGAGLLRIVLRHHRCQLVYIERVLLRQLVFGTLHESNHKQNKKKNIPVIHVSFTAATANASAVDGTHDWLSLQFLDWHVDRP